MPTTLTGILIFVVLLAPGFAYLARTETRTPGREYTALRETATIVSASLLANGIVLVVFGLVRWIVPDLTPDVGDLVRDHKSFVAEHYLQGAIWAAVLLCASSALAFVVAVPPASLAVRLRKQKSKVAQGLAEYVETKNRGLIAAQSGWGSAFYRHRDRLVHLDIRMKDGTWVAGKLLEFNPQIDETGDRSLQLAGQIKMRTPSSKAPDDYDVAVLIVAASEIKTIGVSYLPKPTEGEPSKT